MNKKQLHAIFKNYIDKFEMLNNPEHMEYYKWQVCHDFKPLMDHALEVDTDQFANALYKAKECSENIIDSYTQPFYGLVQLSREEPETVRQMFRDLYADDNGSLEQQMLQIKNFFDQSNMLLEKYYPDSFLYKQNSHSVSSYLFLYDPDHHYMYKATQSKIMADCIEFYNDWGTGDNIKLDIYYRMCDEIVSEMKSAPELLRTNASRYDGGLLMEPGPLHDDKNLHILLFDIIYCAHVYNLYDGIVFARPKAKEKQLILEQKAKAIDLYAALKAAKGDEQKLKNAIDYISKLASDAKTVKHKAFGECEVVSCDGKYLNVLIAKTGEQKRLSLTTLVANKLIKFEADDYDEIIQDYIPVLKKASTIERALDSAAKAFAPYEELLEDGEGL